MASSLLTLPLRGGVHPIDGICMDGSDLNDDYTLKSKTPYKYKLSFVTANSQVYLKENSCPNKMV